LVYLVKIRSPGDDGIDSSEYSDREGEEKNANS